MKPARLILLLVAIIAGGLAAFLVTRGDPAPQPMAVNEAPPVVNTQILVAGAPIGMGERLSELNLQWQEWPESALRAEYVTIAAMPNATTDLNGSVARFEFFPGEPIREAKLVRADQGYLSAVLAPGKRGVSVPVSAESSAGGFVVPNDHVDVLLTSNSGTGERSEVILSNVRILAIGKRLGEVGASGGQEDPAAPTTTPITFDSGTIATLELDPAQAEVLINAATRGTLALTLRSVADFRETSPRTQPGSSQTVRLIRMGREQSISASAVAEMAPQTTVTPTLPQINTAPLAPAMAAEPSVVTSPQEVPREGGDNHVQVSNQLYPPRCTPASGHRLGAAACGGCPGSCQ